jgi:hypothetical protein
MVQPLLAILAANHGCKSWLKEISIAGRGLIGMRNCSLSRREAQQKTPPPEGSGVLFDHDT